MNMFELASRKKFRFQTPVGFVTAEDLWDLPLQASRNVPNLDAIAIALSRQLKADNEESFVKTKTTDTSLQPKFDIVKYIIDQKVEAKEKAEKSAERRRQRQRVLELLSQKEDESLASKSQDELKKLAAELQADDDEE